MQTGKEAAVAAAAAAAAPVSAVL
eukprot:SAG22_NODE_10906_length_510_cov_1.873479_1_plen_23_part_10